MNDWKDLEIGNIPSDFFVNERYEIEISNSSQQSRGWMSHQTVGTSDKIRLMKDLQELHLAFRYKLKPLKSIRITKELSDLLYNIDCDKISTYCNDSGSWDADTLLMLNGHPVEIIGDDE